MPITDLDYQVICSHSINKIERELVIITPISEKEEAELDKLSSDNFVVITRSNQDYTIEIRNVIAYGQIDFHQSSDDFNTLENMTWLNHMINRGVCIPADYNYDEHCCYSPISSYRYYDSTNPAYVSQYYHARLGKPERCLIFKEKRHGAIRPR